MPLTLTDILKTIPTPKPDEVERVRQACALALSMTLLPAAGSARISQGKRDSIDVVISAVHTASQELKIDMGGPAMLRRRLRIDEARAICNSLVKYAEDAQVGNVHAQERLLALGFRLLYDDLAAMGIMAVTPRVLMTHASRIPAIFDRHFPGYAAAGWLRMALRTETRKD